MASVDTFQTLTSLFMLSCSLLGVICSFIFVSIVIVDRRCRSPIVLVSLNTAVAGFIINIVYGSQAIYQMISSTPDALCEFRGFLLNSASGLFYQTLFIQALYRLFVTVFAQRRYLQSKHVMISIVVIQWIIAGTFGIPTLVMGEIQFQQDGRICQVAINDIFGFVYVATFIYFLPVTGIMMIYILILKYTKRSTVIAGVRQRAIEETRQRRELRFIRKILVFVAILVMTGFPYVSFFSYVNISQSPLPSYGHRLSFMCVAFGQGIVMLLAILNTDAIRKSLVGTLTQKFACVRGRRIQTIQTINGPTKVVGDAAVPKLDVC